MKNQKVMQIGNKLIGDQHPVFIIAELSANHGFDIKIAKDTIKAAKDSGADAVKIQTYTADTITIDCNNEYFRINEGTQWDGQTLYELYKKAYMPWEWQSDLKVYANSLGLEFFSSPFDFTAVDFLEELDMPAYKIASFEITDIPLIEYVAKKNKPIIISTGVATLEDIELAVATCKSVGNNDIALLKCTSAYPAKVGDANLRMIPLFKTKFDVIVGLSDHTIGITLANAATVLGANIIEKHFILDKKIGGPDASFSLEPTQFKQMVYEVRNTESALGEASFITDSKQIKNRRFSRSLFVIEDIAKGSLLTKKNVRSIRPADGLPTKFYRDVLGCTVKEDIKKGTPLSWGLINQSM